MESQRARETSHFTWSKSARQFTALIGYHLDDNWRRQRSRYYFGDDKDAASGAAAELKRRWEETKALWPTVKGTFASLFPKLDWGKPVWLSGPLSRWFIAKVDARNEAFERWKERWNCSNTIVGSVTWIRCGVPSSRLLGIRQCWR